MQDAAAASSCADVRALMMVLIPSKDFYLSNSRYGLGIKTTTNYIMCIAYFLSVKMSQKVMKSSSSFAQTGTPVARMYAAVRTLEVLHRDIVIVLY